VSHGSQNELHADHEILADLLQDDHPHTGLLGSATVAKLLECRICSTREVLQCTDKGDDHPRTGLLGSATVAKLLDLELYHF
jgi:hypothetical protein